MVFGVPLALSFAFGHDHFSMRAWSFAVAGRLPAAGGDLARGAVPRAARRARGRAEARAGSVRPAAPPLAPARREHLRPVPDLPRVPAPDLPRVPAREEPLMPVAAGPARSWPERGRRRLHQVVRFDRLIEVAAQQRRPDRAQARRASAGAGS